MTWTAGVVSLSLCGSHCARHPHTAHLFSLVLPQKEPGPRESRFLGESPDDKFTLLRAFTKT